MRVKVLLLGVNLLVLLTACVPQHTFVLSTEPQSAEVWIDGKFVGGTPYSVTASFPIKELELKAPGYFNARLQNVSFPASNRLHINLFPNYSISSSTIFDDLINQSITSDWSFAKGIYSGDLLVISLKEDVIPQLIWPINQKPSIGFRDIPYSLVFSPDGFFVAYLTASTVADCENGQAKLWVAWLTNPTNRTNLFESEREAYFSGCNNGYGFSPNSNWVWAKVRLAMDSRPVLHLFEWYLGTDISLKTVYSAPVWSSDSKWIAYQSENEELITHHFDGSNWELVQSDFKGWPISWSPNKTTVWVILENDGHAVLQEVDPLDNKIVWEHNLEINFDAIGGIVWNSLGEAFVFLATSEAGTAYRPNLVMVNVASREVSLLNDKNYEYVLYWLEDISQIATLVNTAAGTAEENITMEFVPVP